MSPSNDILENEPNNPPSNVIHRIRGGYVAHSGEYNREVEVPNPALREPFRKQPPHQRTQQPHQEEERQTIVHLASRELPRGTDNAPYDRRRTEDLCRGTNEAIMLGGRAYIGYIGEHPCLHAELYGTGDDGADDLGPEHGSRRDLHVVTELEVWSEIQGLNHGDVSPCLEEHHGDRTSRKHVSDDQLGDDAKKIK